MKRLLLLPALAASLLQAAPDDGFNDAVDRNDPNFVKASLLIADAGDSLFTCVGHAFIRMECPSYRLDYCFSYESEQVGWKVTKLLSGNLKMGLFAVPTAVCLDHYRDEGRGVWQYPLNLKPVAKRRLWRILDGKLTEGVDLPYNYSDRGCALASLRFVRAALGAQKLEFPSWPAKYDRSKREIMESDTRPYPWIQLFLQTITGTGFDAPCDREEKIFLPHDLLEMFRTATVDGTPLLVPGGETELLPRTEPAPARSFVTPFGCAWVLLALTLVGLYFKRREVVWCALGVQTALGLFLAYLLFCSDLPNTNWNWLFVPYNPLPFAMWRWRRFWALPFAGLLAVWTLALACAPHQLTDPAYLPLTLGLSIVYVHLAHRSWKGVVR